MCNIISFNTATLYGHFLLTKLRPHKFSISWILPLNRFSISKFVYHKLSYFIGFTWMVCLFCKNQQNCRIPALSIHKNLSWFNKIFSASLPEILPLINKKYSSNPLSSFAALCNNNYVYKYLFWGYRNPAKFRSWCT